jgi:hypothetical protein
MKLVSWAQEEVYSLQLLFLNSKFMFFWRLQPTSMSPCLFWILKVFCVFCLAFVVASYNLGACNCHDYACNRFFCLFVFSFVNMASYVSPLWKLIFGSFVLTHVATSSHSSTTIEIVKVTPFKNKLEPS